MAGKFLWILDNGHGENTHGKRSPKLPNGKQLLEYEFNRDIVKRLIILLNNAGFSYHNLVPELTDISLATRVQRANSFSTPLMKIYVSIHSNAQSDTWGQASGIETYCFSVPSKSERLAKCFQNHLITQLGWKNRGVKTNGYYVIKNTQMPAILTENGFFSNKDECIKLLDNTWRDKIALAHFLAIEEIEQKGVNF